jgi:hypothetical protein
MVLSQQELDTLTTRTFPAKKKLADWFDRVDTLLADQSNKSCGNSINPYPRKIHPPQCGCDFCWNHVPSA